MSTSFKVLSLEFVSTFDPVYQCYRMKKAGEEERSRERGREKKRGREEESMGTGGSGIVLTGAWRGREKRGEVKETGQDKRT